MTARDGTRGLRRGAALALGIALVVAPFTARNLVVSGEPVLLSAAGGMNLWIGNHAEATGLFAPPPGYDFEHEPMARDVARRLAGRSLTHSEASDFWRDRALADIAADRADLVVPRIREAWKSFEAEVERERRGCERDAAELAAAGREAEAGRTLAEFCARIWARASQQATELASALLR